ncbi:MAG: topoisomerase protein [candidate division WWE3 bacterium GW2011_GWA1_41_8]|uniref:DNA topoisomerase 1 n=1 Tax=candidate division WWE3 bacterium GW2011_GWA1_41_8 TaxID=1619103 RepID=A0A0G1AA97_UNCKA|nr:MAG: topoisomerase protein [candidate division WWE3 bacterium GW2011_GWA1_41_8]
MSKLVIVESPTKAKTLNGILGKEYVIKASMGHIRDLPKSGLGVDIEHNFEPEYIVPDKAKKTLTELKKSLKETDQILLATDPDREGEAIAWHLKELLKPTKSSKNKYEFGRVVFHELTKSAVEEAFEHPGVLDMNLVDAQQARRVLDRLVGYRLSPLLWKKVRYGLSAGRVQSVAVRLVVERERERDAFKSVEYWSIEGEFENKKQYNVLAELSEKDGNKIEIGNEGDAKNIESELKGDSFIVEFVKKSERQRKPYAPFKTSTLQQSGSNVFGLTAKRTMSAAQKLFEQGYITYHRTDSLTLAPQFVESARIFVEKKFGKNYLPETGVLYKTKSKNAQEAHEAIRPTDLYKIPGEIKNLTDDEFKVYSLIWMRSIESQMLPAIYDQTSLGIRSGKGYLFKTSGSIVKFDGWMAVTKFLNIDEDPESLSELPEFVEGESLQNNFFNLEQHFTQPPARYSDATLIKTLEEMGIGRPSTYAPTISTIQARGYVRKEAKYFVPEDVAYVVNDLLVAHFSNIVDYEFTAILEEGLDKIAEGEIEWVPVIREFFIPFEKQVKKKDKDLKKVDVTNLGESDERCPECGKVLVFKLGKYGKFLSCSDYPKCEYAKPLLEDKVMDENGVEITDFGKCEVCEDGIYILKKGKFGKFLACSNYPKCKTTKPFLEKIGMKCPKCTEGDVVVKKAKGRIFYGCSRYPDCDFSSWKKPVVEGAGIEETISVLPEQNSENNTEK